MQQLHGTSRDARIIVQPLPVASTTTTRPSMAVIRPVPSSGLKRWVRWSPTDQLCTFALQDRGKHETRPSRQEQQPADRRDRTETRRPGEHDAVETAREEDDAGGEEPAGPPDERAIKAGQRDRRDEDRERVG